MDRIRWVVWVVLVTFIALIGVVGFMLLLPREGPIVVADFDTIDFYVGRDITHIDAMTTANICSGAVFSGRPLIAPKLSLNGYAHLRDGRTVAISMTLGPPEIIIKGQRGCYSLDDHSAQVWMDVLDKRNSK